MSQDNIVENIGSNIISVTAKGNNNVCLTYNNEGLQVSSQQKYLLIQGTGLSMTSGKNYLWWLNGTNRGSQVAPTKTKKLESGEVAIIWDITKSGLNDNCKSNPWTLNGTTIFGLTSTSGTSTITYIGFVSDYELATAIDNLDEASTPSNITFDETTYSLSGIPLSPSSRSNIIIRKGKKMVVK